MLRRPHLILSACLITLAAGVQACPDHPSPTAAKLAPAGANAAALVSWKPRAWRPAMAAAVSQGLRVALDPETGMLGMPSPAQAEALARVGEVDERPTWSLRLPDGSFRALLDERWEQHAVATVGADGRPRWTCVNGRRGAERFMLQPEGPTRTAPAPEEK